MSRQLSEVGPDGIGRTSACSEEEASVLLATTGSLEPAVQNARGLRWDRIVRVAHAHGIAALLLQQVLRDCPDGVPAADLEELRRLARRAALRNLAIVAAQTEALAALGERQVRAIVLKGAPLATRLHADVGLRPFDDLDLLIDPSDVTLASEVLEELGYHRIDQLPGAQGRALSSRNREVQWARDQIPIELHWALTTKEAGYDLAFGGLWQRRRLARTGGRDVAVPALEDELLFLCSHGAKHHWLRLKWIWDMARLLVVDRELDWSVARSRARSIGATRALHLGLLLAHDCLAAPLPADAAAEARADTVACRLANEARARLFLKPLGYIGVAQSRRFQLDMRERVRDRARMRLHWLLAPNAHDWSSLRLPDPLYPLYYVVRPLRLAGRWVGGIGRAR